MQKRNRYVPAKKKEKKPRINEGITAPRVRLVDEEDSEEMSIAEAIAKAQAEDMDLIEISPNAKPPIVKITDFGRFMYAQKKKEQKQKAHNKQTEVKMLRFSFRTEKHDLDRIVSRAKEFLEERHLVKLVVRLRGREMTNKDYAKKKLMGLVEDLKEVSDVEQEVKPQGNQFTVIVRPKRGEKG
ncbi:translation initiation factor IF-3 [Candidatus Peregrinibacteria bacterium]|jgi:translation initiation factor IF-3|nr:translation initiation factor IF-3 [Candidatus Peregrinibacteria bacterium]MBT5468649.1 translation initiation factor IF-3 [Candidatus Peregrinibacteria bacterium]MBT7337683.1 translation initiation factor IF-3 [Candidatus Peregrinibacteria bacterium]MBT7494756.1 translation initiation factor IF-3 [Candidatus Peribacter sp.]